MKKEDNFLILHEGRYILKIVERETSIHNSPNFKGTGLALVGMLKKNETIEQFKKRIKKC